MATNQKPRVFDYDTAEAFLDACVDYADEMAQTIMDEWGHPAEWAISGAADDVADDAHFGDSEAHGAIVKASVTGDVTGYTLALTHGEGPLYERTYPHARDAVRTDIYRRLKGRYAAVTGEVKAGAL